MGQEKSVPLPPASPGFEYCSVSFIWIDTVRVLPATDSRLLAIIRSSVTRHWGGIQKETADASGQTWHNFKLMGQPFGTGGKNVEAVKVRQMACQILVDLYAAGWRLLTSTDLSRNCSKSTWIFKKTAKLTQLERVCCLNVSGYDAVQLINGSNRLRSVVLEACTQFYHSGVVSTKEMSESGDVIVKLRGSPWHCTQGSQLVEGKYVILQIIQRFFELGYQLYATFNSKDTTDSLFFIQYFEQPGFGLDPRRFMAVSLDKSDRLRFLRSDEHILTIAREVVVREWPKQIVREMDKYGSWEVRLGGLPWKADYGPKAIASRCTVMRLLQRLHQIGWRVLHALDLSRLLDDKSTFIFESCSPANNDYLCLAPMSTDKLYVIGCSQQDDRLIRYIQQVLGHSYPMGIKYSKWVEKEAFEFKFHGSPWFNSNNNFMHSRTMMTHLLKALNDADWQLVTSCDTSGNVHYSTDSDGNSYADYSLDVHSWIFCRQITH